MIDHNAISPATGKKLEPIITRQKEACCCNTHSVQSMPEPPGWKRKYWATLAILAILWGALYIFIEPAAPWITSHILGIPSQSAIGGAIEFFIYDSIKILLLLAGLIYAIAWLRVALDTERIRTWLSGKKRSLGYFLGAMFGAITPFCSCSSIPLFLGFTTASIPFGITMAFLITSPLINEIAVILLWGLLGWKFTVIYVLAGMAAGMAGGLLMDALNAERWLQPFILESARTAPRQIIVPGKKYSPSAWERHKFAFGEMRSIFRKVWIWVVAGVAIGAGLHGFVPDDWFARHFGAGEWWTVPAAVLVAIPLYSNVTGIVPIMESLLSKGLPAGTTLAFCMSAVAASIPELMLLKKLMTFRLQAIFIAYLWVIFTLLGWLFNFMGPALL